MRLSQLAQGLLLHGDQDPEITGITHDSRKVVPGSLFCALRGHSSDGRRFIPDALDRGAVALLVQEPVDLDVPQIISDHPRKTMALLADRFFGHPSGKLRLVGITGTNGKTTTAFMVHGLLRELGQTAGLITTIKYMLPDGSQENAIRTTPESPDINEFLRNCVDMGARHAVMEVSSHGVCEHRIDYLSFAVGVFTNMGRDHLDYHGSYQAYLEAKLEFFRKLPRHAVAVVNADDQAAHEFVQATPARVMSFSNNGKGEIRVHVLAHDSSGIALEILAGQDRVKTHLPMPGLHNAANAAAATGVMLGLGFDLHQIAGALRRVSGPPGRFEKVWDKDFLVLVDYAHTPQALARTLRAGRLLTKNRLWVVFGAGGDRDQGKRPIMGETASKLADVVVITTDNPRHEQPQDIIRQIVAGTEGQVITVLDRREAISYAISRLEKGDVLIIAGKGHENYMEIGDRRIPFSDREVALEVLNEIYPG